MILSKPKCLYCKKVLTSTIGELGYTNKCDETATICQRCFQLINYNALNNNINQVEQIAIELGKLNLENSLIFLVVDLMDLKNSLIPTLNNQSNLIILINKFDLLPEKTNFEIVRKNIINYIDSQNFNYRDIMFISARTPSSIKRIKKEITKFKAAKLIVLGKSNNGKSTLIKNLAKEYDKNSKILISSFLNTTLSFNKIHLRNINIIDTPGYLDYTSILNFISQKDLAKILISKISRVKIFQLTHSCSFKIENLARLNILGSQINGNCAFYLNPDLKITKTKLNETLEIKNILNEISYQKDPVLSKFEFENIQSDKCDLVIPGLGIIALKNITNFSLTINSNVIPYLIEKAII